MATTLAPPVPAQPGPRAAPAHPPAVAPPRDRFLDVLRLLVMALVVLQHWALPVVAPAAGSLAVGSVLEAPGGFAVTWVVQVMPLIFFVGGAANVISLRAARRRGQSAPDWLARRLRRLAWPVLPLALVWLPLGSLLLGLGAPEEAVLMAGQAAGMVLWFLATYLLVVVSAPVLLRLEERHGWRVCAGLLAGVVAVDALRLATGVTEIGYLNVVLVWAGVHQLGMRYADGALSRRVAAVLAAAGFATAVAVVLTGLYSPNMTGVFDSAAANINPPTLALAALGAGQVGLAVLVRGRINAWWSGPGAARFVDWAQPRLMTVYLWHMLPVIAVLAALMFGAGVATPPPFTAVWWVWSTGGAAAVLILLVPLVGLTRRFEQPPELAHAPQSAVRVVAAAALTGAGLLVLTATGLTPDAVSVAGVLAVGAGLALTCVLRLPRRRTSRWVSRRAPHPAADAHRDAHSAPAAR